MTMLIPAGALPFSEAQIIKSKISPDYSYKFDEGFKEKLQGLSGASGASGTRGSSLQYYNVILVTNDKEDLVNDLQDDYLAINIFNPENLDNVVIADVPVALIEKITENYNVIKIGDGQLELESHVAYDPDNERHSSIKQAKEYHGITSSITETGSGITVGVINPLNSLSHNDLPASDIIERVNCYEDPCTTDISTIVSNSHFNKVASVITGTGSSNSDMVGVAPDSKIILTMINDAQSRVDALNYLVGKNVDLITIVSGSNTADCSSKYSTSPTIALVIDHVVKLDIPVIASNGNYGINGISDSACSYNGMAIGNTNISGQLRPSSSRGSLADTSINPDMTAMGSNLGLATTGTIYEIASGTSFSAPMVAGASALLLDKDSSLTSNEIRTALLVGAEFGRSSDSTAKLFDTNTVLKNYMKSHGFGKLEIANSLTIINDNHFSNLVSDVLVDSSQTKKYRINVNSGDLVKVLMSWNVDTAVQGSNNIVLAELGNTPLDSLKDYNLEITKPDDTKITSNSNKQNKEFAFFTASQAGIYEIKVTVSGQGLRNVGYTLGSSHALDDYPYNTNFITTLQQCMSNEICNLGSVPNNNRAPTVSVSPSSTTGNSGDVITMTATASDPNNDPLSITWEVAREDVDIDLNISSDGTSASFTIPHHTSVTSAYFLIRVTATDQYNAVSNTDSSLTIATISPDTTTPPMIPVGSTIWSDDFEDGNLDGWTVNADWRSSIFDEFRLPPNHGSDNKVAEADNCDVVCTLTRTSSIDMTDYNNEFLQFYRYVDISLDSNEYLKVEVYNGNTWIELDKWSQESSDDDDMWHLESYDLSDYTNVSDFKFRFSALMSASNEDVGIDDVQLIATSVSLPTDTTPPVITQPSDVYVTSTDPLGVIVSFSLPSVNEGTIVCDHQSGDLYPIGITTVICTATDGSNNSSFVSFDVIVTLSDSIDPIIYVPIDKTFEATGILTTLSLSDIGMATATDNTDLPPTITNDAPTSFPLGDTVITWIATDDSNNFSAATQTITIQDTLSPAISTLVSIMSSSSTVTFDTPTAIDLVDGTVDVTCDHTSGSEFTVGSTVVTCTATDNSGNSSSVAFNIIVAFNNSSIFLDTFDSNLDSWTLHERPNTRANDRYCSSALTSYSLIHSSEHSGSAHTDSQNRCWFGSAGGIKSFNFPSGYNTLDVSLDYRSLASIFGGIGHVNNIRFMVLDSAGDVLGNSDIYRGARSSSLTDTTWLPFTYSISNVASSDCPCKIFVYLADSWSSYWTQENYFDNVTLDASATASQMTHSINMAPNSLSGDDLLDMQSSNSTVINTVNIFSDAIRLNWDDTSSDNYKVVIAQSESPRDKFADITDNNSYTFVNLEPDTSYDIRVGIRGDDSTQSILQYTTLPTSTLNFDSNIILNAAYNSDTVHLMWLDLNDFGDNRYRVEISIDGVSFEETSLRPGANSLIEFTINDDDDYAGDTIYYRIFEWYGNQKIYSNHVSVVLSN